MKLILIILLICLSFWNTFSQDKPVTTNDTIELKEIFISHIIPLNDATRLQHYQTSNVSSIDKINSRLGSVSVISRGAYAMEPVLQSFSGGQVNITIGGMKMFGACTDKMDPITSYIEPINLGSISINHGSNGSINGSTNGGSFDMLLKIPTLNTTSFEADLAFESISMGKTGLLNINYGKEKLAYRASGVLKKYKSYTDGDGITVPFTLFEKTNVHQALLYVPSAGNNISFDWLIDNARNIGYPALPMDVGEAKGRIYSLSYASGNSIIGIQDLKLKVYANSVYHLMDDSERDSLYFVKNSSSGIRDSVYMKMDMPGWSNTYGAFAEGTLPLGKRNNFFLKLENYYNWAKAEMTMHMNNLGNPGEPPMFAETWPEHRRNVLGLYLKNRFEINKKSFFSIDLRLDNSNSQLNSAQGKNQFRILGYITEKKYTELAKSINLNFFYVPKKSFNLKAGMGYGERLPTLSEQFGFYLFNALDGYDYIGNPDISLEKSSNLWLNLNYLNPELKINWQVNTYFLNNYILGTTKPEYQALNLYASGVKQYSNLEGAFIAATNIQLVWKPLRFIELFNVTKYNYGKLSNDSPLPLIPPLKSILSASYKKPDYFVLTEFEYSATQKRINRGFGEITTASFLLINLRGAYKVAIKDLILSFYCGIENLFDKTYSEHLDWGDYNRPGRSFQLGLNINY